MSKLNIGLYVATFLFLCSNTVLSAISGVITSKTNADMGFVNLVSEIFFYLQLSIVVYLTYFLTLILFYCCVRTEKCLKSIGYMLLPCMCCVSIAFYIYCVYEFIVMIIYLFVYFSKDIYPDLKTYLATFLIFIGVNIIFSAVWAKFMDGKKEEIKNYHTQLVRVYEVTTVYEVQKDEMMTVQ